MSQYSYDLKPVRKPGYVSPREKEASAKKLFSKELIKALEAAELSKKKGKSQSDLAREAFKKLEYDCPVSSTVLACIPLEYTFGCV